MGFTYVLLSKFWSKIKEINQGLCVEVRIIKHISPSVA